MRPHLFGREDVADEDLGRALCFQLSHSGALVLLYNWSYPFTELLSFSAVSRQYELESRESTGERTKTRRGDERGRT